MKSWNCVEAGGRLSLKLAVKQHSACQHIQLVQRAIKKIVPVWRQFYADADADSVSLTVTSPTYRKCKNCIGITYSFIQCKMRHENMQSKQHFITNLNLQIWVRWPS